MVLAAVLGCHANAPFDFSIGEVHARRLHVESLGSLGRIEEVLQLVDALRGMYSAGRA